MCTTQIGLCPRPTTFSNAQNVRLDTFLPAVADPTKRQKTTQLSCCQIQNVLLHDAGRVNPSPSFAELNAFTDDQLGGRPTTVLEPSTGSTSQLHWSLRSSTPVGSTMVRLVIESP